MSRVDHGIDRFRNTMGNSWWWRRFADLVDRRVYDDKGKLIRTKPFDWEVAEAGRGVSKPLSERQKTTASPGAQKPEMLPRPEGMTRQQHRRLYREACKLAGVPWKAERRFKVPRRERGRNWKDLSPEEASKLEAHWKQFTQDSVRIE